MNEETTESIFIENDNTFNSVGLFFDYFLMNRNVSYSGTLSLSF